MTGSPQPGNDNNCQNYTQLYAYDEVGNIQTLQHIADAGSYTRTYNYDTASNKLLNSVVGSYTYTNTYDARGNVVSMPHLAGIIFNADNYMASADLVGGGDAYYQYSDGQRGRKTIVNGAITEERLYLGSYEIYRKYISGSLEIERTTVHIADDTGRIAMLEVLTYGTDDSASPLVRYVYNNHISTATLELDDSANIISYEEYHPYGTTSYQAMNASINATAKRYRFTGKERDEENGFYYIGARYYAPWLTRWMACDPINNEWYNLIKGQPDRNIKRQFVELTAATYEYCYANPVRFTDPTGEQAPTGEQEGKTNIVKFVDSNGNAINKAEGEHVQYKGNHFRNFSINGGDEVHSQEDYYDKDNELVAGIHVISPAAAGAGTLSTTYTYEISDTEYNKGRISLVKEEQNYTLPAEREGTQTTVVPGIGPISNITVNAAFIQDSNQFSNPVQAQAQIQTVATQLNSLGINNVNVVLTTGYVQRDQFAAPLLQSRYNAAVAAFANIGISVNPPNFNDPTIYNTQFQMIVQFPQITTTGWNVTTQTVRQPLDSNNNPVGDISIVPGTTATTFIPAISGQQPQSNINWQNIILPQILNSKIWSRR